MAAGEGIPGLAEKLNRLFDTTQAPTRSGRYSNDTAAAALAEKYGITVSGVHLSHLRANRRDNPSARLLWSIAELFGVPITYFLDTATEEKINAELATLSALRNDEIKKLMQRAQGVSPRGLHHLHGLLDQIRIMEGLDPEPDDEAK